MPSHRMVTNTLEPETITLDNGRKVVVREVCKKDGELEKKLFESLSPESRRDRFIGGNSKVTDKLIELLTDNDHDVHEALIAIADPDTDPKAVGVAHYACDPNHRSCECAAVIADDWQHHGLGTRLMTSLTELAQTRGLDEIYSIDSAENRSVHRLAKSLGFECRADPHDYTLLTYSKYLHPDYLVSKEAANRTHKRH